MGCFDCVCFGRASDVSNDTSVYGKTESMCTSIMHGSADYAVYVHIDPVFKKKALFKKETCIRIG